MSDEQIELAPCPFCGGPVSQEWYDGPYVACLNDACDVAVTAIRTGGVDAERWNHRPAEDALRAECDAAQGEAARLREAIPWAEIYFAWDALGEKRQRMTRGFGPTEARNHAPELAQFIEDNDELVGAAIHAWERAHAPQQQEAQEAQNE